MSKFIDEVIVSLEAGSGGAGCISFRREKFIPFGGPNGGDGGDGGDIYFEVVSNLTTLAPFTFQRIFKAENGQRGSGSMKSGKRGQDLIIPVPKGTKVFHDDTNTLLYDLTEIGQKILIAKGGYRGHGNLRFKTSTNRAPRHSTPGYPGEILTVRLELQVLADVGLVGFPNAGKSSLIRQISQARPKVADYAFTTLTPQLGVVHFDFGKDIVIADIPGLIEGASQGLGLGNQFLRHISRTRLLLFVLNPYDLDNRTITEQYEKLEYELSCSAVHSITESLPRLVVVNKIDTQEQEDDLFDQLEELKTKCNLEILLLSALNGRNVKDLKDTLYKKFFDDNEA